MLRRRPKRLPGTRPRISLAIRAISWKADLLDFALINYSVPAERLRPHLPKQLELETYFDVRTGQQRTLISTARFTCANFRPTLWRSATLLRSNGFGFEQLHYRAYVRFGGRPSVYFLGTSLSRAAPFFMGSAFARDTAQGRFHLQKTFDATQGYSRYICDLRSPSQGHAYFRIRAQGPPRSDSMIENLTSRPHGLFVSSIGPLLDQVVRHRPMLPWFGELFEARFDFWERLGVLTLEEAQTPLSVWVEPEIPYLFAPPIPAAILVRAERRLQHHRAMSNENFDTKERKGGMGETIRKDSPGIEADEKTITNDPFRQQVENNANQRQTEDAKKNEAEGDLFVQGQSYRDAKMPTQADQVTGNPRDLARDRKAS